MRRLRGVASVIAMVSIAGLASEAAAQQPPFDPAIDVQLFEYSPGPKSFFTVNDADLAGASQFSVDFLVTFLTNPFTIWNVSEDEDEIISERTMVVESMLAGEITGAYGISDSLQLGVALPLVFSISGQGLEPSTGGPSMDGLQASGLGDLRAELKARLWRAGALRLAAAGGVSVPTSFASGGNAYIGDDLPTARARLAGQWSGMDGKLTAGVNLGVILRKPREIYSSTVGQQLTWGAAAAYRVTDRFSVVGEGFGRAGVPALNLDSNPLEVAGGVRVLATKSVSVLAGGGTGVVRGIGSPGLRMFVSVGWAPDYRDEDGDGIPNLKDRCPLLAEDLDGFEDGDGCPDDDNDGDKREDSIDKCPNEPEDLDGFEDMDGCPEDDNDGDGIKDLEDKCPEDVEDKKQPYPTDGCPADKRDSDLDGVMDAFDACPEAEEDIDEFEDWDGCPDADNDKDGVPDIDDQCPLCPEDRDGHADDDGCPDFDNDGDGLTDDRDQCTGEAETINGIDDFDGCPDNGGAQLVSLDGDKMEFLRDPAFRGASLRRAGEIIIDQAALVILQNPEVSKWMIVVGAPRDAEGRAAEVKGRLLSRGVPDDALEVLGSRSDVERFGIVVRERRDAEEAPTCPASMRVSPRPEPDAPVPVAATVDAPTTSPTASAPASPPKAVPEALAAYAGVSQDIQFRRNSSRMVGKSAATLRAIAALLVEHPHVVVEIHTHTDIRKGPDASQKITAAQAEAAAAVLREAGVPAEQIRTMPHGMDQPIADNDSSRGRAQNRRLELQFTVK